MGILYPAALSADGQVVLIEAAMVGNEYRCLYCKQRMVARKGERKVHHFAHHGVADCPPNSALHTYAQMLILEGHAAANEYRAEFQCRLCTGLIGKDVKGYTCIKEANLVKGARSDIAFVNGAGGRLAVEIVVTHEMEPSAVSAYQADNIPVMIVKPKWDNVEDLYRRIRADAVMNIKSVCKSCKNERQIKRARRKEVESFAQYARRTQWQAIRAMCDINETGLPFARWRVDRFGNPMCERTQSIVFADAQRLVNKGWQQRDRQKPWVFTYDLPFSTAYADFGGQDDFPIDRYTAAWVYVFLDDKIQRLPDAEMRDLERYAAKEVIQALESVGVSIADI